MPVVPDYGPFVRGGSKILAPFVSRVRSLGGDTVGDSGLEPILRLWRRRSQSHGYLKAR
jgi:hypothetical protein